MTDIYGRIEDSQDKQHEEVDNESRGSALSSPPTPFSTMIPVSASSSQSHSHSHSHTSGDYIPMDSDVAPAPANAAATFRRCLQCIRSPSNCLSQRSLTGWPLLATYLLISFAQEMPVTALGLIITGEIKMSPADQTQYYAATMVVWTIRPVYSFISDQVPLGRFRRRPYFFICAVLAGVCQLLLAMFGTNVKSLWTLGVITQLFLAWCEVECDSLSVEWGNDVADAVEQRLRHDAEAEHQSHGNMPPSATASITGSAVDHLFRTTPDPSTLTSLSIKSRIQSECATVRSCGSLLAAAVAMALAVGVSARGITGISAGAFAFAIVSLLFHKHERAAKKGLLFFAATDEEIVGLQEWQGNHGPSSMEPLVSTDAMVSEIELQESNPVSSIPSDDPFIEGNSAPQNIHASGAPSDCCSRATARFFVLKLKSLFRAVLLLIRPLLFIFLLNAMPSSLDAFESFLYAKMDEWDFKLWQYHLFTLLGLTGSMLGYALYHVVMMNRTTRLSRIFVVTSILDSAFSLLSLMLLFGTNRTLGISNATFICTHSIVGSLIGAWPNMPPILLAAAMAPRGLGLEGSMFSLFAAVSHAGSLVSAEFSALLTSQFGITLDNFDNLWKLKVLCSALSFLPLLLMPILINCDTSEEVNNTIDAIKGMEKKVQDQVSRLTERVNNQLSRDSGEQQSRSLRNRANRQHSISSPSL